MALASKFSTIGPLYQIVRAAFIVVTPTGPAGKGLIERYFNQPAVLNRMRELGSANCA
jgi:hypothetical protein